MIGPARLWPSRREESHGRGEPGVRRPPQAEGQAHRHRPAAVFKADLQFRRTQVLRKRCRDHIIFNVVLRAVQEIHVADDAGHPEFVLVLQITAVTPFQDQDCQKVLSLPEQAGDVKLRGMMRDLAVADVSTVQPHIEAGIHTLKIQIAAGRIRIPVPFELMQISAAGILPRHKGRIKRKRIADVRVLVLIVSPQLPAERHLFPSPAFVRREPCLEKFLLQVINTAVIPEQPLAAAQHREASGSLPQRLICRRNTFPGSRNIISPDRKRVLVKHRKILKISRNDQISPSFPAGFSPREFSPGRKKNDILLFEEYRPVF